MPPTPSGKTGGAHATAGHGAVIGADCPMTPRPVDGQGVRHAAISRARNDPGITPLVAFRKPLGRPDPPADASTGVPDVPVG